MNANVMIKIEDLPQSVAELTTEQELAIVVGGDWEGCNRYRSGSVGTHDDICNRSTWDDVVDDNCTDENGQVWHNSQTPITPPCYSSGSIE